MDNEQKAGRKSRLKQTGILVVAGMLIGVVLDTATEVAMKRTETLEFCAFSCHEMTYAYEPYRASAHYSGRTGVRAVCVDCHIPPRYPQRITLKVYRTVVDVWQHFAEPMDTREKFEAQKYRLATSERARFKANDSAECRDCHRAMNPDKQPAAAREVHRTIAAGTTCIDCHAGIVHGEPAAPKAGSGK
jgi:cytochrome c-type protein NapC